jgi:hypothetical protein
MRALRRFLGWRIGSDLLAAKVAQTTSYVLAIGFVLLAVRKMATFQLTESQLFFGMLLVLAVFLLIVCGGSLARIEAELTKKDDTRQQK